MKVQGRLDLLGRGLVGLEEIEEGWTGGCGGDDGDGEGGGIKKEERGGRRGGGREHQSVYS